MPQEALSRDLELERVAAAVPDGAFGGAKEDAVLRLRRREGAEIMLTDQEFRRFGKPLLVERPRIPPAAPRFERRGRAPPIDPVAVASRLRRATRVEVGSDG